ncbi:hypothetical protein MBH78_20405 [Oceanimonas sp. NS1]|nr:hypothetical protein [Oceanimonas sp. NS1]
MPLEQALDRVLADAVESPWMCPPLPTRPWTVTPCGPRMPMPAPGP